MEREPRLNRKEPNMSGNLDESLDRFGRAFAKKAGVAAQYDAMRATGVPHAEALEAAKKSKQDADAADAAEWLKSQEEKKRATESVAAYEKMQRRRDTADTVFLNEDGTVPTPPAE